jgi:uncharacterized protein YciU (UPF0263 family)
MIKVWRFRDTDNTHEPIWIEFVIRIGDRYLDVKYDGTVEVEPEALDPADPMSFSWDLVFES